MDSTNLTVMYLYYNQPEAIEFFEKLGYPDLPVNFMFIDDGSKEPLKLDWANVIRIDKDIPWNQPAANNLGFRNIWGRVLRMDIDHYFKLEDFPKIHELAKTVKTNELYHFKRITKRGLNKHRNIYLTWVSNIQLIGGYDEDFCGNYGYDDLDLMFRLSKNGVKFKESDIEVFINHDLRTKGLDRNVSVNYQKFEAKL